MDAAIKQKWVKALRSGKYKQGMGSLRSGTKYCCLGVLAAVAGLEISKDGETVNGGYCPLTELLGGQTDTLWWMNDQEKKSFAQIADYIEANL